MDDNKGLIKCCKESDKVYPVFIFTPEQVTNANKYKSNNAIQFMVESLEDLDKQLEKIATAQEKLGVLEDFQEQKGEE